MTRTLRIRSMVVVWLLASCAVAMPGAMADGLNLVRPDAEEPAVRVTPDEAASIARAATGARVLSVELRDGKRPRYRIKLLAAGGRVRTIHVDARSGKVAD